MNDINTLKLLFIINPGSGNNNTDWHAVIRKHFETLNHTIELFDLSDTPVPEKIKQKIAEYNPNRVVAVGGDGTVKLVAQCLMQTNIPLGILPAGSANGLAKDLGIPEEADKAMDILLTDSTKKIHVIKINDELCIHLSDIGFNAYVIKKFEQEKKRGMWSYVKATWKVLWNKPQMFVEIKINNAIEKRNAAMVVIANATRYGSGAVINPRGKLNDDVFEVVIVKKISGSEIFKMLVTHQPYNAQKTELLQTTSLQMKSAGRVHFQVDGEYLGKVNNIKADILTNALEIMVPEETNK